MSMFPRIAKPCPYIDRLGDVIEDDFCRMCKRQVHDLTDLDEGERAAFLRLCGGDACVSYVAMVPPALATALVAASVAALLVPGTAIAAKHKPHSAAARQHRPPLVPVVLGGAPVPVVTAGGLPVPEPKPPAQPQPVADRPDGR